MVNDALMGVMFGQDFALRGEGADTFVKPIPRQYALTYGSYAAALASDSIVDKELAVMKILDPEEYIKEFPDAPDRMMKSYVLASWRGTKAKEPELGWFSRSRLLPLDEKEYGDLLDLIEKGEIHDKAEVPEWFMDRYREITDELASEQPDMVERAATCGKCKGRDVDVHWSMKIEGRAKARVIVVDGQDVYLPADEGGESSWHAHLHCNDCGATGTLDEKEFRKPDPLRHLTG
jgi:hypothetical protein